MNYHQMCKLLKSLSDEGWIIRKGDNWQTYDAAERRGWIQGRHGSDRVADLTLSGLAEWGRLTSAEIDYLTNAMFELIKRIHVLESRHD